MKGVRSMVYVTDMELSTIMKEESIVEIGRIIRCMVRVHCTTQMDVLHIRGNGNLIR